MMNEVKMSETAVAVANDLMDNHMDKVRGLEGYNKMIANGIPAGIADTIAVCMLAMVDTIKKAC